MKKIFIVGGNGFARECYLGLKSLKEYGKEVIFGGFLGHGGYGYTVDYKTYQHLYLGEVIDHKFKDNEYCVIGAGYPELRRKIYNDLKNQNAKFYTLICEGVKFSDSIQYGEANIFIQNMHLSTNISIGIGNVFNGDVITGHDDTIGDFNFFGPRSQILGGVKIGNDNTIGANSILLPNAKIGNNNCIAPLSVIYKGCRDNCYMQGNPALKVN